MSSFTTPLDVRVMADGRKFKVIKKFTYHIGSEFSRNYIVVPRGFITDFASTDILQWAAIILGFLYFIVSWFLPSWVGIIFMVVILLALLITPFGKHTKGAVLHDFIYQTHIKTRKEADEIFKEAMMVAGTPGWKAQLMYLGVRAFGFLSWKIPGIKE